MRRLTRPPKEYPYKLLRHFPTGNENSWNLNEFIILRSWHMSCSSPVLVNVSIVTATSCVPTLGSRPSEIGARADQLVEIPSPKEVNDNIIAYWVPKNLPPLGQLIEIAYRIHF